MNSRDNIAYLHLTTFAGIAIGASHYYAELKMGDDSFDVTKKINAAEAKNLNRGDDFNSYRVGMKCSRMISKDVALKWGIKLFHEKNVDDQFKVLIVGDRYISQASEILFMENKKHMKELNKMWSVIEQAYDKAYDPWEEFPNTFQASLDAWEKLFKKYTGIEI